VDLKTLTAKAAAVRERSAAGNAKRNGKTWYTITNATADQATIHLYDMIGEWGITAQDFVAELNAVTAKHIDLHVSSEGGEVFDGIAIYASLVQHPATITAHVDSLAASAASFIVQAADTRIMGRNARMMIHDAQGLAIGDASAMRALANLLDDLSNNIADIYAERAGGTVADWRARMQVDGGAGTWYTADSAVAAGLADEVAGATKPANALPEAPITLAWDSRAFLRTVEEAVRS
jgi:ATP-dependent protease ClpP protease subunit